MKKRRRIPGKILIGLTGLLGAALSGSIPAEGRREMEAEASRFFLEEASRTFLAGMTYQEVDEIPAGTWIAGQAMQMIPVGMYVDSRFSVSTQVEDAQTYQMILAQQENDENAVDQEGNLIGENKTAEAAAPGAQAIDTSMEKLSDYEYLLGNFYTVDSSTMADSQLINAENLLVFIQ